MLVTDVVVFKQGMDRGNLRKTSYAELIASDIHSPFFIINYEFSGNVNLICFGITTEEIQDSY